MSEGLGQYESTVAGFGNATESIKSYVATYDTDFFRNWTEKHNLAMEKLKSAQDISGGIGGSVLAGQLAYKNIKERFQKSALKKKRQKLTKMVMGSQTKMKMNRQKNKQKLKNQQKKMRVHQQVIQQHQQHQSQQQQHQKQQHQLTMFKERQMTKKS